MTTNTASPTPAATASPKPSIRGTKPAVQERHHPLHVNLLTCWLLLLGTFLVVNGAILVYSAKAQVNAILVRRTLVHSRPEWLQKLLQIVIEGQMHVPYDVATSLAEHVTQTLGATYISLGLLAICLSLTSKLTGWFAAFALVSWSLIQLIISGPQFLSESEASNRTTFHTIVVLVTALATFISSLWPSNR